MTKLSGKIFTAKSLHINMLQSTEAVLKKYPESRWIFKIDMLKVFKKSFARVVNDLSKKNILKMGWHILRNALMLRWAFKVIWF